MSWNNRVIIHEMALPYRNYVYVALHEVFYKGNGQPDGMTCDPIRFVADVEDGDFKQAVAQLAASLRMALNDIEKWPPLYAKDIAGSVEPPVFQIGRRIAILDTTTKVTRRWRVEAIANSPSDPVLTLSAWDHTMPVETVQIPQSVLIAAGAYADDPDEQDGK